MKILIGEISSYKAIVIARYIKSHFKNVDLLGYDYHGIMSQFHTKYIDCFVKIQLNGNIDEYVNNLAHAVASNAVDVFIPVHSDYIGYILKRKDLFGSSLNYYGSFEDYEKLHLKNIFYNIAIKAGLRVPQRYRNITEATLPFVIKPNNLSSAKGVRYCRTEAQRNKLKRHVENNNNIIIEEFVDGDGCGYEMYCENGRIITSYGHIRLAEYPISGGSSVYRGRYIHPAMNQIAMTLLKELSWTGFLMLEFKLTPSNELVLIEANPRVWGSINQALEDGCEMFDRVIKAEKTHFHDGNNEIYTYLSPQIFLSICKYMLHGNMSVLKEFLIHRHNNKSDVNIFDDPMGVISMILRKLF